MGKKTNGRATLRGVSGYSPQAVPQGLTGAIQGHKQYPKAIYKNPWQLVKPHGLSRNPLQLMKRHGQLVKPVANRWTRGNS